MIYKGFEIKYSKRWQYQIFKDGVFVCAQPSEEFAKKWIDEQ